MKQIRFNNENWQKELTQAYSFRFTETPDFTQKEDCITTCVNPQHREGYDNISLLSPQTYTAGVKATLRCAFEGVGCPEIILVKQPELCEDGAVRYGDCVEVVLWKNGVNVWRHYRDEETHRCHWHLRLGFTMPMKEQDLHLLEVEVIKDYLLICVDGIRLKLRMEDLFETFHVGVTACEGIARLYEFQIFPPEQSK